MGRQLRKLTLDKQVAIQIDTGSGEVVLAFYAGKALEDLRKEFRSAYPDKPLENLYDFNHYFLETLAATTKKAIERRAGIVVSM
jgi:hypothetical protein